MLEILQYQTATGVSPFGQWFDKLDAMAAAKVTVAVTRMSAGNFGDHKSVGAGVLECRIDFGVGYRIYFGRDGDALVILLVGGTKKRQQQDVAAAKEFWMDYKARSRANKSKDK
jgi:putative addiction module killer protein